MVKKNLLSAQTLVEAPFITVKLGNNILGTYQNNLKNKTDKFVAPNYITNMTITKINGAVNQYSITLVYVITPGSDPNMMDKMLSSVSTTRKITISYGDCNQQGDAFRNEEALIVNVTQKCDFKSPKITYTISAVSAAVYLKGVVKDQPARKNVQPSKIIRQILMDTSSGLRDVFVGMFKDQNIDKYKLIPTTDKKVDIPAQSGISTFEYIKVLVSYMTPEKDNNKSFYFLQVIDTDEAPFYGSYFRIVEGGKNPPENVELGAYDLDIGYPGNNYVSSFDITTSEQWSILYDYAGSIADDQWTYTINDEGETIKELAPRLSRSTLTHREDESNTNWWKFATEYPITATVTLKGLVRPVILVEYVKLNVIFFGRKSIYSGLYIITEETDSISGNGITTTLKLTRVKGDKNS